VTGSFFLDENVSYGLCGTECDLEVCSFKDVLMYVVSLPTYVKLAHF